MEQVVAAIGVARQVDGMAVHRRMSTAPTVNIKLHAQAVHAAHGGNKKLQLFRLVPPFAFLLNKHKLKSGEITSLAMLILMRFQRLFVAS